jgi:hypothetical protein
MCTNPFTQDVWRRMWEEVQQGEEEEEEEEGERRRERDIRPRNRSQSPQQE